MASKPAPINAAVLDWALREAGLTDEDLAVRSKIEPTRLTAIRSGDVQPKTGEFRTIARVLGRAPTFFFLPKPPSRAASTASFRLPPGRPEQSAIDSNTRLAIRKAARWQKIIRWARAEERDASIILPSVDPTGKPVIAADAMRSWLDWDVNEQKKTTSPSAHLRLLRARCETRGLVVLQFSMGRDSSRGFSIPDDAAPVIGINSSYNPAARVFTLVHELTHLIRGDRAICEDVRDDHVERWCEQAAAAFLLPADELMTYLDTSLGGVMVEEIDKVRRIANRYQVSIRSAAVRLIELKLAPSYLYELIDKEFDFGSGGFNPNVEPQTTPVRRLRELGTEVPRTLLRARDAGYLTDTEVRRYLDVSGNQLTDLARRLADSDLED